MFPRHLICGSAPIYIRIRHLIGWPADHFTYISSVFDMLISNHLHTHSAFNMLASKRVFDIRYYNVDLQTCVLTQYSAVITSLCSSVLISMQSHIPLSAYVGRQTFHIYIHSVFDIGMNWSVIPDFPYIVTRCLICGSATIHILAHLTNIHFTQLDVCVGEHLGRCRGVMSYVPLNSICYLPSI